jgi:hypothetical protein
MDAMQCNLQLVDLPCHFSISRRCIYIDVQFAVFEEVADPAARLIVSNVRTDKRIPPHSLGRRYTLAQSSRKAEVAGPIPAPI